MLVLIKGAGDLASGIALRLFHSGYHIVMTETACPTTVRRTVAFSGAVYNGSAAVEDVTAVLARDPEEAEKLVQEEKIAVLVDPACSCLEKIKPDILVDAIIAKQNLGTQKDDAPIVIGVGPGFTAGEDCDAVVETKRGHTLGRVFYTGSAIDNTGIPGDVGGYTIERLIKAPCAGCFVPMAQIGEQVRKGQVVAKVGENSIEAGLSGVVRGMLPKGISVSEGMKCGDIDPRDCRENCYTVSDKALAIAGGVLEAILHLQNMQNKQREDSSQTSEKILGELQPKVSIRFFNGEKCFGPGVAELLERIEQEGSLRAASFSMNMSYSKAWSILRECEKNLNYDLVTREIGGARGGGAKLTRNGKQLLMEYRAYCSSLNNYAEQLKNTF